jgi:hypothetical protein
MVWDTVPAFFVDQEQRRRELQLIQELEVSWSPPVSRPPSPGLDWSEEPSTNGSSSILERVADFLNF